MKIIFLLVSLLSFSVPTLAQEDVDPEVMNAILDIQKDSDPIAEAIVVNPSRPQEMSQREKALEAAKQLREGVPAPAPKEVKPKVVREVKKRGPEVISAEEAKMLEKYEKEQAKKESINSSLATDPAKNRKPIYVPAPVEGPNPSAGYLLERDSSKIITRAMNTTDALNVKICYNAGVTISFDHEMQDEIQRVILDDPQYFSSQEFENRKGVIVALKRPIPEGTNWESAVRIVRKKDDKTYLVNLIGLPCPPGMLKFPKVIYLKDHVGRIASNNKILTPEDMIIQESKGLPRIPKNKIRVYDMVASSGSQWSVFGIEVQYPTGSKVTVPKIVVLDNHQVQKLNSKLEYLPIPSKKATEIRGVSTLRFKLTVNMGKNYILKHRYLHLMYVDEEVGHYQYIRVDTLPYFLSLVKRGFDL